MLELREKPDFLRSLETEMQRRVVECIDRQGHRMERHKLFCLNKSCFDFYFDFKSTCKKGFTS